MAVARYDLRWRRYGDDDWTVIENLPAQTSYRMEGLRPLTFYEIQVRATDEEGTGRWSPTGIASTDPGIAYNFRYRPTGPTDWTTVAEFLPDPAYRAEGLTPGTEYEAQARTVTPADESEWTASGTASTESQATAPSFADDTGDPISGTVGTAISAVAIPPATGNPNPAYSQIGASPSGITVTLPTLGNDGSITGTPTAAGSGTITVRATNSEGNDDWTVSYSFSAAGPALTLADHDQAGYDYDFLALIEAGFPSANTAVAYGIAPRNPTGGSIVAGDLMINGVEPITWLRFRTQDGGVRGGARISFNDDDLSDSDEHLGVYYAGDGNDLEIVFQTLTDAFSFPVAGNIGGSGNNYVIFNVPAAHQSIVNGLIAGDRFIIGTRRVSAATPVAAEPGSKSAGSPTATASATVAENPVTAEPGSKSAGNPTATASATVRSGTPISAQPGTKRAGAPTATVEATVLSAPPIAATPVAAEPGAKSAGAPTATARAAIVDQAIPAEPGAKRAGEPTATVEATVRSAPPIAATPVSAAPGTKSAGAPTATVEATVSAATLVTPPTIDTIPAVDGELVRMLITAGQAGVGSWYSRFTPPPPNDSFLSEGSISADSDNIIVADPTPGETFDDVQLSVDRVQWLGNDSSGGVNRYRLRFNREPRDAPIQVSYGAWLTGDENRNVLNPPTGQDGGVGDLDTNLQSSDPGADLSVYLAFESGVVYEVPLNTRFYNCGIHHMHVRLDDADVRAAANAVAVDDLINLVIALNSDSAPPPPAVSAEPGSKSAGVPTATASATVAEDPVSAEPGSKSAGAPTVTAEATVADATSVSAEPGSKSAGAPTATAQATVAAATAISAEPGSKSAGAPSATAEATVAAATPISAEPGSKSAGAPTASAEATVVTFLTLDDHDQAGYDYDFLALIEAGFPSANTAVAYGIAPRNPTGGSIVAGDLMINGVEPITWLRFRMEDGLNGGDRGGARISFNDDDLSDSDEHLGDYYAGDGNDLEIVFQTLTDAFSFPVAGNIGGSGNNYVIFNVPAAHQSTVNGLIAGDRFIIGTRRVSTATPVSAEPGTKSAGTPTATASATVAEDPVSAEPGSKSAGAPTVTAEATVADATSVSAEPGSKSAGAPTATAQATVAAATAISAEPGSKSAGAPSATAEATVAAATPISAEPGSKSAGAPTASAEATVVTFLTLDDHDQAGYDYDFLALIEAGFPSANTAVAYGIAPRNPTGGSIVAGDLMINGVEPITWLRFRMEDGLNGGDRGGARISFNDDDLSDSDEHLGDYYAGDGNDLEIVFQTLTDAFSFPVAGNIGGSGNNYVIFNVPAAHQSIVNGLIAGDRFIIGTRRVATATPVSAEPGAKSAGAPTATASATVAEDPVSAVPGTKSAGAPTANVEAAIVDRAVAAEPGAKSAGAPTATVEATVASGTAISAEAGSKSAGNPTASVEATVRSATPVTAEPGSKSAGSPTATARAAIVDQAIPAEPGAKSAGAPTATARATVRSGTPISAQPGTKRAGAPTATVEATTSLLPLENVAGYARSQARSLAGVAPRYALEVAHPDITNPVRIVADNVEHTIEGNQYIALAFRAEPPQFKDGEIPRATLEIDNVGRELTQWVETTGGGRGAKMRVMMVYRDPNASLSHIAWELPALAVGVAELTNQVVSVQLVYRSGRSRPGIKMRFDPVSAPGLF